MIPHEASARKYRLFAVAVSKAVWHLLDAEQQLAIQTAETYADDKRKAHKYSYYRTLIHIHAFRNPSIKSQLVEAVYYPKAHTAATRAATLAAYVEIGLDAFCPVFALQPYERMLCEDVVKRQNHVANAIFRAVYWTPKPQTLYWNDKIVPALAKTDDYPVLADALEEAGEDNVYVLSYLRTVKLRVKGDHVIDKILGKK